MGLKLFIKGTSVHIKKYHGIKQLCNHKVRYFAPALRTWKVCEAFKKRAQFVFRRLYIKKNIKRAPTNLITIELDLN